MNANYNTLQVYTILQTESQHFPTVNQCAPARVLLQIKYERRNVFTGMANRTNEQQCSLFMNIEWNQCKCNSSAHTWLRLGILRWWRICNEPTNFPLIICIALIRTKIGSHTAYIQIGLHAKSGRPLGFKKKGDCKIPIASASSSLYIIYSF